MLHLKHGLAETTSSGHPIQMTRGIEKLEDSAVKRPIQADLHSQKTINAITWIMHHKPVSRHGVKFPSPLRHYFQ